MSKKIKLNIPCNEANHICDKSQYKESSFFERIKLNIHLLYCKSCRKYTKNNIKLTKAFSDYCTECLDKECKEKMKRKLEAAIKNNPH